MNQLKIAQESEQTLSVVSKLLTGIVSHLNPEKDTLWPVPVNNTTTALALDLLAVIIFEGKHELSKFKQIMVILDEVFDPLLNQITSMKNNYSISIRLINCITLFTIFIEWGLEPLTRWCLTFINIKANSWQKLIAFEVFTYIFSSKSLVKQLSESNEQWWLANILKIMEQHLESVDQPINDEEFGQENPSYQSQKLYKHLEEKNFDTVILPPNNAILVKLLIEAISNLCYKFNDLSEETEATNFKHNILSSTHVNSLISLLTNCLHMWEDEINIQTILNTFQNLLYISGKIGNSTFRAVIINSLGKYASPTGYDKVSHKNILVIKCTLNIYHCLNEYLDPKWWYYIFKIFQKIEPIIREELGLCPVEEERMNQLVDKNAKQIIENTRKNKSATEALPPMKKERIK